MLAYVPSPSAFRTRAEHVLRKIHCCTFRSQKLDSNFWTTFFTKKFLFFQPNFRMTFLSLHKQPFITAHFDSSLHILCITAR